jgi:sugar phosphate isomerase/epimerase
MPQRSLGLSLHKLDPAPSDDVLSAVEGSRVATFEIAPSVFDGGGGSARKAAYRAMLDRSGKRTASVHARHGWTFDLSSPDENVWAEAMEHALAAVDLAVELDAPIIVFHASCEPIGAEERSSRLEIARRALARIADRCGETGRRAAVEFLPRTCLGNTLDDLVALSEGLPSETVGFCLDTNHLMDRPDSLPDIIRAMGPRLTTLHISDYDGVDEKHWLPGLGVVDWRAFMDALNAIGYAGPFNFECTIEGDSAQQQLHTLETTFDWMTSPQP